MRRRRKASWSCFFSLILVECVVWGQTPHRAEKEGYPPDVAKVWRLEDRSNPTRVSEH